MLSFELLVNTMALPRAMLGTSDERLHADVPWLPIDLPSGKRMRRDDYARQIDEHVAMATAEWRTRFSKD